MSYTDEILNVSVNGDDLVYRHTVPNLDLSVERHTVNVPHDGLFHVIHKGQTLGGYESMSEAEQRFGEVVKENNYELKSMSVKVSPPGDLHLDEYVRQAWKFP
jgi:hypothetical protein